MADDLSLGGGSAVDSLLRFVRGEGRADEIFLVWPTGSGKTRAALSVVREWYSDDEIDKCVGLVLRPPLVANLRNEMITMIPAESCRVFTFHNFFAALKKPRSEIKKWIYEYRTAFLVDEIDQVIPHTMHPSVEKKTDEVTGKEVDVNHWKSDYYEKLKVVFRFSAAALTRKLVFLTATPFASSLDEEIERYVDLMWRPVFENESYLLRPHEVTGEEERNFDAKRFLMDRMHAVPVDVVMRFYKCRVEYQVSGLFPDSKLLQKHPLYVPFLLPPPERLATGDDTAAKDFHSDPAHNPKMRNVLEEVSRNPQERAFVMCRLLTVQRRMERALVRRGVKTMVLTGSMSLKALSAKLEQFAHDTSIRVLVVTEFLSAGLSIPNVEQIHILEPFAGYQPSTTVQSIGRCVRLNSHSTAGTLVRVWLYVCVGTLDVRCYKSAMKKQEAIDEFFVDLTATGRGADVRNCDPFVLEGGNRTGRETSSLTLSGIRDRMVEDAVPMEPARKTLMFASENFPATQRVQYALLDKRPAVDRMHSVYGAYLVTHDQVYDLSQAGYDLVMSRDDESRSLGEAIAARINNDDGSDESTWYIISGRTAGDLRRHVVTFQDRKHFRRKGELKRSVLKGAGLVNQDIEKMLPDFAIGETTKRSLVGLRKADREKKLAELIYEHSVASGTHITMMEGYV